MKKIAGLFAVMAMVIAAFTITPTASMAQEVVHKVAFHIDDSDPKRMNMVLNNVKNVRKYYDSIGEKVIIEVVAYGPGLIMLREDKSPVKERIAAMALEIDNLTFAACGNTRRAMSKKAGMEIPLINEAVVVTSGVVQLITLQEKGYSYVRP